MKPVFQNPEQKKRLIRWSIILCAVFILAAVVGIVVWQTNGSGKGKAGQQPGKGHRGQRGHKGKKGHKGGNGGKAGKSAMDLFVMDKSLVCSEAPMTKEDRRKDKNTFKLVNFNALFLFLTNSGREIDCPGPLSDPGKSMCDWENLDEAKEHLVKVSNLIKDLDADFVHLSEVEGCHVLESVINHLPDDIGYEHYLVAGTDTATGQNVGFLSRVDPQIDLVRSTQKALNDNPYNNTNVEQKQRQLPKNYFTILRIFGKDVYVFGLHLIAIPSNVQKCAIREAQVKTIINFFNSKGHANKSIVVLGDFNDLDVDDRNSGNPQPMGAEDGLPVSKALQKLRQGLNLKNALIKVPKQNRFSTEYSSGGIKTKSLIDHVLVSEDLFDLIDTVQIVNNTYDALDKKNRISDHYPVVVTFKKK